MAKESQDNAICVPLANSSSIAHATSVDTQAAVEIILQKARLQSAAVMADFLRRAR